MKNREVLYFEGEDDLLEAAKKQIIKIAKASINRDGNFTWALSGGNSPRELYSRIARSDEFNGWENTYLFWSDERVVSLDDVRSNYRMAKETLLNHVDVLEENVFPMDTSNGDDSALIYEQQLKEVFKRLKKTSHVPSLDLILLGVGIDGHTASLFPKSVALREDKRLIVKVDAPNMEPTVERLTFTIPLICRARNVIFFVSDKAKKDVVRSILKSDSRYPASLVNTIGNLWWFIIK